MSASELVSLSDRPGDEARLSSDPDMPGAFRMDVLGEGGADLRSIVFPPSATRPEGLPDDLPFVPGCLTTWTRFPVDEQAVFWTVDGSDSEPLYDLVCETLQSEGWRLTSAPPLPEGSSKQVALIRGSRLRILVFQEGDGRGLVSLVECASDGPAMSWGPGWDD